MAFFQGATFVGLFFIGWDKLSRVARLTAVRQAAIGSNFSAFWILTTNGWMQNPFGAEFNPQALRIEMTDFFAVLFNGVAQAKFVHTVSAGSVKVSVFVIGVSAWYLLKGRKGRSPAALLAMAVHGLARVWRAFVIERCRTTGGDYATGWPSRPAAGGDDRSEPAHGTCHPGDHGGHSIAYDFLVGAPGLVLGHNAIEGLSLDLVGKDGIGAVHAGSDHAARTRAAAFELTENGGIGLLTRAATEMKCAWAPLKHTFLIDDIASRGGAAGKYEIHHAAPQQALFSVPIVAEKLRMLFEQLGFSGNQVRSENRFRAALRLSARHPAAARTRGHAPVGSVLVRQISIRAWSRLL